MFSRHKADLKCYEHCIVQMSLKSWKMETYKHLACLIMTRDWHILSLLIRKLTHSLVKPVYPKQTVIKCDSHYSLLIFVILACRWDVYIWLFNHTTVHYLQSNFERWFHARSCANNNIRTYHDAWLCHYWELCDYHGSSNVLPTKGMVIFNLYVV